ncbi:hypothetical protein Lal_00039903, partial [Lupinus albus]
KNVNSRCYILPVSHIPEKCMDPGTFIVPCIIGNRKFENFILHLGASINVMPMNVFKFLSLGPLQPTGVVIQLANKSTTYPAGLVEDVLVRVDQLIFHANFYILYMEEGSPCNTIPIILGRPFFRTARTKIDVHAGTLSLEFDDKVFIDKHLPNFLHHFDAPSFTNSYTCHACIGFEICSFCIDEFLNIVIVVDSNCTSLYTCHACTDSELCDSCIDEFLNIVVDSSITHSHCTNTIDAGIIQQSALFVRVQASTKPMFATFFPFVLQTPDWTPPIDLVCD